MKSLPDHVVVEAFALSNAHGADLLVRLGDFNVWRGDLAAMRGDSPRGPSADSDPPAAPMETRLFLDALLLARAIELIQPVCRAALSAVYAERKDAASLAEELDTTPENAQRIIGNCEKRLLEAYDALLIENGAPPLPQWAATREDIAVPGNRRR